jgi:hypothetical protein
VQVFNSFMVNFVIKTKHKKRASTLSKALTAAGLLGIGGYGNAAHAAKQFFDLKVLLPSNGEIFNLKIETKGKLKTKTRNNKYTAPSNCEPAGIGDCPDVASINGAQLKSPAYSFTGYKIVSITGTALDKGVLYDVLGPGSAEKSGVFNYPDDVDNPVIMGEVIADSIPHSKPDQLFNPRGLGLGFDPTEFDYSKPAAFTSFPADALDNYFSFGGITFDIGHLATPGDYTTPFEFVEPYQLFTVPYASTSAATGEPLIAGGYAGCPGSCRGAVIQTPGPLPLLGIGAAFGFSRNLRKRIKASKSPEVMSALG